MYGAAVGFVPGTLGIFSRAIAATLTGLDAEDSEGIAANLMYMAPRYSKWVHQRFLATVGDATAVN